MNKHRVLSIIGWTSVIIVTALTYSLILELTRVVYYL